MKLHANGLAIEITDEGPPSGPALLLIMGLGMQLVAWPQALVDDLVRRGFRVIRMDNRDIGLSQHLDALGTPNLVWAALRYNVGLKVRSAYSLADMADDAVAVLDALGIFHAHVCGASMGGMIAQRIAARHPQRVSSLTLIMTTSGARGLPQARPAVRRVLIKRPRSSAENDVLAHLEHMWAAIGSPGFRPDPRVLRERLQATVRRSYHPNGAARQLVAIVADGDRSPLLRAITAPTLVIHGHDDPLVPVASAHDLLSKIAGAIPDIIPGMGHDLPDVLLPRIAGGIAENAARAAQPAPGLMAELDAVDR
ncbi:MAG: alpha/beta fold hydrolase [Ideonella sp.]|nr:alpha/beta fold hydrolase [Ideonella sp.]